MNKINIQRGERIRGALLNIARMAHARGLLMPRYATLGAALGISGGRIAHHFSRLVADGAVVVAERRVRCRRFRIEVVRP